MKEKEISESIDLSQYKMVHPSRIEKIVNNRMMYDIEVEDDHTFHIFLNKDTQLLKKNCDGHHISSLIINLFSKWFPGIIEDGKLFKLVTPLIVCDGEKDKSRKYFQTMEEFNEYAKTHKIKGLNYLKGLGSLSMDDWEWVMKNRTFFNIIGDRSSKKYLDIAFGDAVIKRKNWLSGK